MPLPREIQAVLAFVAFGWRRASVERATVFGRVLLLVLILLIFWAMWSATPLAELGRNALSVEELVWYLAATETVAMSVGFPYRTVEADIQSGDMAASFTRPVHYALAMLATWTGQMAYQFVAVLAASVACAWWMTREILFDAFTGVLLVLTLWIGCLMLLLSQLSIGLLATWMKSSAPAFWVWQKLFFVLGGLIIPLTLYPGWLADTARATPFAAMLFLPASLTFDTSASHICELLAAQAFWTIGLGVLAWGLYVRAEGHLRVHGG